MIRSFVFGLCLLASLSACRQSFPHLVLVPKGPNSSYRYGQIEPSVAIHPKDTSIVAAGSVLTDYYYSKDGASTWTSKTLTSSSGVYGDPVLAFDSSGRLYYFHLSHVPKVQFLEKIVCQYTDAVDQAFSDGSFPSTPKGKTQDKHWVAYDVKSDEMLMTWTQFDKYDSKNPLDSSVILFSKSKDKGATWTSPQRISRFGGDCLDDDNTVEGAVPIVTESGKYLVCWTGPKGLVMQESSDGGTTWLPSERLLFQHPQGWAIDIPSFHRANGLPFLKYNPISKQSYLVWCEQNEEKTKTVVKMSISEDEGQSWSQPKTISMDKISHAFFVNIAVDPKSGKVYLCYYGQKDKKDGKTHVYLSSSESDAANFLSKRITADHFVADKDAFFGDYLAIDAMSGKIVLLFPTMNEGKVQLWSVSLNEAQIFK